MKNLLCKIVPGVLLISLLSGSASAQGRIGLIDLRKVFEKYYKREQAQNVIDDRKKDMEKDIKTMLAEYDKAKSDYSGLLSDANNQILSADEREKRKKSAEDKFKQLKDMEDSLRNYQRQAETTLDEQRKRMRDNLVAEIRNVLTAKAKAAGYSLVLDTSAESLNQTPVVLYNNNENDLTDAIITELNRLAPVETPKAEEKKEEKKAEKKR